MFDRIAELPDRMTIQEIRAPDEWDRFVLGHSRAGYTHLFNWSRVIRETYGHRPVFLAAVRTKPSGGREIQAVLPLFRFKTWAAERRWVSIPFFDSAGILARDGDSRLFVFEKGLKPLAGRRVSGVVLRQPDCLDVPDMTIERQMPDLFSGKVGLSLGLNGSEQDVFSRFKSKLKNQIRKSEKSGLEWKIGKKELIDPFYTVFSRNMRDLGSPVHARQWFDSIFTHFYHQAFVCVVFHRAEPVAAGFLFRFRKTLSNPWASSIREFRPLNANLFLYRQMIRFACRTGADTFDMGRSSRNASTYRFKKQFSPQEHPLFWYSWTFSGKFRLSQKETLSIQPWKKMPLALANLAGPMLRKRISL